MDKRITIKEIAQQAGVSIGTVHCALNEKPGVGEGTRQRILAIAKQLGYRPNAVAASLKRKAIRIAAAFPDYADDSQYYYSFIWAGIRDWIVSQSDFNIGMVALPFGFDCGDGTCGLTEQLARAGEIDGLITTGNLGARDAFAVQRCIDRGIPVILVGDDMEQSDRLCCVQPAYEIIGRMLAELMTGRIPANGSILLCTGGVSVHSHRLAVQGFEAYLTENSFHNPIYKITDDGVGSDRLRDIARTLATRSDIAACYAVNAIDSVLMGQALLQTGRAGHLPAIGSGLFAENTRFLEDGVFTNLLHKKPYSQSYTAARYMTDYLLKEERPPHDVMYIGSELVFRSNLSVYNDSRFSNV